MSLDERVRINSLPANADLSASQYLGVEIGTNGKAVVASVLGQAGNGILYNKPDAADRAAEIAVAGVAKCIYGATVTAGDKLTVMANGKFQKAVAASSHHIWGKARISGANGDIGEIDLDDTKPVLA